MLTNFNNKVVLVTGITGFKGTWLAAWLLGLGAKVVGFADEIITNPSHFSLLNMESRVTQIWGDISNYSAIYNVIQAYKPDYIFHLAAQSLVRKSYSDPLKTFSTNTMGTVNLMEAVRVINRPVTMVLITSDKCYENVEKHEGYVEDDRLGGKDPYSGSKAGAEMAINSYYHSFFSKSEEIRVGIARAGNVIGGGDWSDDRIIPDAVKAWSNSKELFIRFPNATRPWQHVLEPISGYLWLASLLKGSDKLNGQAFNFGPMSDQNFNVSELLRESQKHWPNSRWSISNNINQMKEAGLLRLSCQKAQAILGWSPVLNFQENITLTIDWYRKYYANEFDSWTLTQSQISLYKSYGMERGAVWA